MRLDTWAHWTGMDHLSYLSWVSNSRSHTYSMYTSLRMLPWLQRIIETYLETDPFELKDTACSFWLSVSTLDGFQLCGNWIENSPQGLNEKAIKYSWWRMHPHAPSTKHARNWMVGLENSVGGWKHSTRRLCQPITYTDTRHCYILEPLLHDSRRKQLHWSCMNRKINNVFSNRRQIDCERGATTLRFWTWITAYVGRMYWCYLVITTHNRKRKQQINRHGIADMFF
jgi:hypothetical protein